MLEQVIGLHLVNDQWVFLLEGGSLYGIFQFVHGPQMFFPAFVDDRQGNGLFDIAHDRLAIAFHGGSQVGGNRQHFATTIGERDSDALVAMPFVLVYVADHRHQGVGDVLPLPVVEFVELRAIALVDLIDRTLLEVDRIDLRIEAEQRDRFAAEGFEGAVILVVGHQAFRHRLEHIVEVDRQTLAREGIFATLIDRLPLNVHHVVVLQQALADAEVVLFDLLLGTFDRLGHHRMLDHFAFLMAHAVHQTGNALRLEQAHEVVFQRYVKLGRARIALATRTSAQLAVYPARVVAFRTDNGQTAGFAHIFGDLDVGTPSGHVGGDGHFSRLTGFGNHFRFALVLLGVEHVVRDAFELEHPAEFFRNIHRGGTDQHGSPGLAQIHDLVDHGIELLPGGLEHEIVAVVADYGTVRRDDHHVEFVDLPELAGFRFGRTGHTG